MEAFKLFVLPVSGGGFPVQIAFISEMYEARKINKGFLSGSKDYHPDLVMSASGGNVASYIGMGGDWNYSGMSRMIKYISSNMFVTSWLPDELNFIPTWSIGIFMGSVFRSGEGPVGVLNLMFDSNTIQNTEILTLTYNKTKFIPQIFSNKSENNTFFKELPSETDRVLYELHPIKFTDGNLTEISKVCMASAAIPLVTESQIIGTDEYGDGGIVASSPFIMLSGMLAREIKSRPLQIFLFSPIEFDNDEDTDKYTKYGNSELKVMLLRMIHSQALGERLATVNLVEKLTGKSLNLTRYTNLDSPVVLASVLEKYQNDSFVMTFYPSKCPSVQLNDFKPENIMTCVDEVRNKYHFDIFV